MGEESPAVEVPSYFVCPISLEIMRDPVTLSTGITYDRESIERWVFTDGHGECPVTKQRLAPADREPTPNHTLRRLIQGWCAVHAVERFPTPRPPVDAARVTAIVEAAGPLRRGQQELMASLGELADIVAESDRNRRCVQGAPGAVEFLVSVVKEHVCVETTFKISQDEVCGVQDSPNESSPEEAALIILHSLKLTEESLKRVLEGSGGDDFLDTLACVLRRPSYLSRMQGIHLLRSAVGASGDRTRARAREMLKMHARVWRDSPCLASHLNASYPR
uniref:U-box domain-containing protein n=1 Tax=Oryza brachyantha TaxID=4533 RepID=J3LXR3_ORYBR